ncbi:MAG: Adaptive-response sensory-kinase SasA [Desulfovibrio sp.]
MEILGKDNEKSRVYIAVLTLAVIGLALVFSTWQTLRRQYQASLEHLELTSSAVLQAVETSLRRGPGMRANIGSPGTREFFRDLENSGDIIFVGILGDDGARLLSDGENVPTSFRLPPEALAAIRAKTRWQGVTLHEGKSMYLALRPITPPPVRRHHGRRAMLPPPEQSGQQSGQPPFSQHTPSVQPVPSGFLIVGMDMDKHASVYRGFKRTALFQSAYTLAAAVLLWGLAVRFISRRQLAGKAAYLERLQTRLIDNLPDALLIADASTGVIQAANPAAYGVFNAHGHNLAGTTLGELGLPENVTGNVTGSVTNTPSTNMASGPDTATAPGGWVQAPLAGLHLEVRSLPFQGESGAASLMVIARDRTDIRTLEKNLAEAEKLAAVGSLAAGVAHEIRNPLSALRGFAQYFAKKLAGKEPEEEYANTMVREADRLNRVITDLLYLARPRHLCVAPTDLKTACADTVSLLQFELRDIGITIEDRLNAPTIAADPDGLKQVLLNLFLNAIEAMRDTPGVLTVSSEGGAYEGKTGVWLRVADTGPGMSKDMLDSAFEPFHTTKENGTGLGLALVRAIMRAHGGDATILSPLPASPGCMVSLFFPNASQSPGEGEQ